MLHENLSKALEGKRARNTKVLKSNRQKRIIEAEAIVWEELEPVLKKAMKEYEAEHGFTIEDLWLWQHLSLNVIISSIATDLMLEEDK